MPTRIIRVIGSLNADLRTVTPKFPKPGETLTANSFTTNPGGKGANQAVACARLSRTKPTASQLLPNGEGGNAVRVEMVGAVGTVDAYYETLLLPILEECGIDVNGIVKVPGASTGVAVIIVDEGAAGENRILLSTGANYKGMTAGGDLDVIPRALKSPLPDVAVLQAEIPFQTTVQVLRELKRQHVEIVFNPAPAPPEPLPEDIYQGLSHLIVNETECEQLFSQLPGSSHHSSEAAVNGYSPFTQKYLDMALAFRQVGVSNIIVTLGSQGVVVVSAGKEGADGSTSSFRMIPAEKVAKVVDTTAAGDTFVGAYAVEVASWTDKTQNPDRVFAAVKMANRAASVCVQHEGAMKSVPWKNEVRWNQGTSNLLGSDWA